MPRHVYFSHLSQYQMVVHNLESYKAELAQLPRQKRTPHINQRAVFLTRKIGHLNKLIGK